MISLTIRTTERRKWDGFHELYEEYVQFYHHLKKGKCSTSFFLYPLSQGYYYINDGSASLKENLIRISSKKNCSSSLISRRYSRYMISNTTVLWFNSIIDRRVEFLWNMHWLYPSSRNKVSIIISSSFQWFQTTILDYLIILLYHFYQLIINSQKSSGSMRKLLGWEKENGLMKC